MIRHVQLLVMRTFRSIFAFADEIFSYFLSVSAKWERDLNTTLSANMVKRVLALITIYSCLALVFLIALLSKGLGLLEWSILGVLSLRRFDTSPAM